MNPIRANLCAQFEFRAVNLMRVLLIALDSDYDNSLALDYLVAYARRDPVLQNEVEFCQYIETTDDEEAVRSLLSQRWDVVAFNTYVWNLTENLVLAARFKAANRDVAVVMGGMEASYTAPELLRANQAVDVVVLGEGEIVFADLLRRLLRREPITGVVPGIAYRGPFGTVSGGQGPILAGLDEIPSPFESQDFLSRPRNRLLYESYRGCAFKCGFCLYHRDYTRQRAFSLDRVKSDLRAISRSGCSHIRFVDSTFNLDRARAKSILRVLAEMHVHVSVEVSAEFFDAAMIEMFPPAGIRQVDIGLQSTNSAALETVNRKWYKEGRFRENLRLLRNQAGLTLNVELIAGLPSDDYRGLKHSIDEAVAMWPDHVSVYRLLGLRGTDVERRKDELGLHFSETPPYEVLTSPGFSKEELDSIDVLTFAHLMLFNLGIGRYALRCFVDKTGVAPTELYEDFIEFAVGAGRYDREEARMLGRYYSHGNRFDRVLPGGLAPERVRDALAEFFRVACEARPSCDFALIESLLDYGYRLALLDRFEETAAKATGDAATNNLYLAPWCQWQSYPENVYRELQRQGAGGSSLDADDIGEVLFFIHPTLGPASVAVTPGVTDLLERLTDTNGKDLVPPRPARLADFGTDEQALLAQLQEFRILLPTP